MDKRVPAELGAREVSTPEQAAADRSRRHS